MTDKFHDVSPVPNADPQVGLLLSMLDDGTKESRKELGEIDDKATGWQPFPKGHNIGSVILHMAFVEAFWLHEVTVGETDSAEALKRIVPKDADQYDVNWPTPPQQPLSWYYDVQDDVRQRSRQIISEFSNAEMIFKYKEHEITLRWLLHHVIAHEAYHGGQLVLLALQYQDQAK